MKRCSVFVLAVILLLATAPVGAGAVDLRYTVTIQKPEDHVAHVKLVISDIDNDVSVIHLSIRKPSDYDEKYVENLAVTSPRGSVRSDLQIEGHKWICEIATVGENTITIEYDVRQSIRARKAEDKYVSYIGSEFAVIDTSYLFLLPDYHTTTSIRIEFGLPSGWKSVAVWDNVNGTYKVDWRGNLRKYVALGPFHAGETTTNNVRITATRHPTTYTPITLEEELKGLAKLTEFYIKAFGFVPSTELLFITAPSPMYYGKTSSNTFARLTTPHLAYFWQTWAHEYAHLWNGGVVYFDNSAMWFAEGGTNFFADLALLNTGLLQKSDLRIFGSWLTYKNLRAQGRDAPVSKTDSSAVLHAKGELVTYLLSKQITEVTNNKKSLYDVARYLFQNCQGRMLSSKDLLEAVNRVTGHDFTDFFSDYVHATTELSLGELDRYEIIVPQLGAPGIDLFLIALVVVTSCGVLICAVFFAKKRRKKEEVPLALPHEF